MPGLVICYILMAGAWWIACTKAENACARAIEDLSAMQSSHQSAWGGEQARDRLALHTLAGWPLATMDAVTVQAALMSPSNDWSGSHGKV